MRKFFPLLILGLLLFSACAKEQKVLTFYHTNDIEGFFWARNNPAIDNKLAGGMAVLKNFLDKQEKPYLLFDSGNTFAGTPEGQLGKMQNAVFMMNMLGYSAATLSPKDLTLGIDAIIPAIAAAKFPIVVSNLKAANGTELDYIKSYTLIDFQDIKIGIVGLLPSATLKTDQRNANIKIEDEIETLQKVLPVLQEKGAQIIILLSSIGFELQGDKNTIDEKVLAEEFPQITLILGGNSEISPLQEQEIAGVYITRSKENLESIQETVLTLDKNNKVNSFSSDSILLEEEIYGQAAPVLDIINPLRQTISKSQSNKVATLEESLETNLKKPSTLGYYTAQCIKNWGKTEIGLVNSNVFINGLHKGIISQADLQNAIPYDDRVMFIKMRGDDLKNALEASLDNNNWPQIAGLEIVYDSNASKGNKIKSIKINNTPLKDAQIYSISATDHIIAGGFGHNEFLNMFEFKNTDRTLRDILRWCLSKEKTVKPQEPKGWKAL
jgi:2',3'-cyclic-nucleotide 2'-phosphodiesterase (5'-nucleotidase family)